MTPEYEFSSSQEAFTFFVNKFTNEVYDAYYDMEDYG